MKKMILSGIYFLAIVAVTAQTSVVNVKNSETANDDPAVVYSLPRTALEIEVEAIKTTRKAGPYAADANKYLKKPAEIQRNEEVWAISQVSVKQKSEPDATNQYKVYAPIGSNAVLLTLTETGILKGINLPASSGTLTFSSVLEENSGKYLIAEAKKQQPLSFYTTNFPAKEDDAEQKPEAAIVFEQINSLRDSRLNILSQSGDALQNGSAIEAYLREIDNMERELTALFNGKEQREIVRRTFTFYPDKEGNNQEIFRFSEKLGFADSGNGIFISIEKKSADNKTVFSGKGKTGFVYRQPAFTNIEVKDGKNSLWKGEISVAQLGKIIYLPAGLFDKNDVKALFDTNSGALLLLGK